VATGDGAAGGEVEADDHDGEGMGARVSDSGA